MASKCDMILEDANSAKLWPIAQLLCPHTFWIVWQTSSSVSNAVYLGCTGLAHKPQQDGSPFCFWTVEIL